MTLLEINTRRETFKHSTLSISPQFPLGKSNRGTPWQGMRTDLQMVNKSNLRHEGTRVESKKSQFVQKLTSILSPITATRKFLSGSHNVMTFSAATARTEPSIENVAAVIGFCLQGQNFF